MRQPDDDAAAVDLLEELQTLLDAGYLELDEAGQDELRVGLSVAGQSLYAVGAVARALEAGDLTPAAALDAISRLVDKPHSDRSADS